MLDIIEKAKKQVSNPNYDETFNKIYPGTTENIKGYIDFFDLKNKSLLTVGSSSDQVLNACFNGCYDITLIDINPFTKEFFHLKKAAIERLDYEEYLKFLSFRGDIFRNNKALNIETLNKVLPLIEDKETLIFWKYLFENFKENRIRRNLFSNDIQSKYELIFSNKYLENENNFNKMKSKIKNLKPYFINDNIYNYELKRNYDNIFLSNIADYYEVKDTHKLFNKLINKVNEKGQIQVAYFYETNINTEYLKIYCPIYNLKKTLPLFKKTELYTFKVTPNRKMIQEEDDSILVYKKK